MQFYKIKVVGKLNFIKELKYISEGTFTEIFLPKLAAVGK